VAEDAVGMAGLLVLVPAADHVLLENIAVDPRAQGSGVGRVLMELAEERTRALHLDELRLYTNEAMVENLAYYRRHGYQETHRALADGFRRVYFAKRLS
jgi:ribosomal protein S18 acetylase RimI-like enzyme